MQRLGDREGLEKRLEKRAGLCGASQGLDLDFVVGQRDATGRVLSREAWSLIYVL